MAETSQKTLIDITALKYFYKSLQNVTVLIAPSTVEAASPSNLGHTYFIPADGTYAGIACAKGDHIVSNGTTWVLIPKGTSDVGVTSVTESTGDENKGKIQVVTNGVTSNVPVHGLGTAAYTDVTDTYVEDGTTPVSGKAVKSAISGKLDANQKGANGGVAELDESGKVLSSQLPSYVDDVIEATSKSEFPATGESGKIYVDTTANLTYRWTGTAYTEISPSIALGVTSSTAFRGDHGKTAYDHATTTNTNPHGTTASDVGLGNVGNFKAVSTVESQGLTDAEKANARTNIGAGTYSKPEGNIPKTDLASDVQTSLGKADTALQAADKTELQNKIDEKLNKTAVLSDFSSSELTGKVLSAELSLDTFTKKVTTESANNNTRIITVPEDVDCFAGIGMIGGKTQKCKNFYDCLKTEPYSAGKETVTTTENSVRVVMSKAGTYGASKFVYSFTAGKSYTLSADVTISSGVARLAVRTADNTVKAGTNPITASGHYTTTFTATSDMSFVSLFATWDSAITGDVTYSNIMLVEGNAEIPYEPYHEDLWNAPVTDVESVGINVFDEQMELGELNTNTGLPIVSTTNLRTINFQKVLPSTKYYLLSAGANANVCFYDANKTFISCATGVNNSTFTTPSNCGYVKFRLAAAYGLSYKHDVAIIAGETGSYIPYNKTTISLDTIINNLPDYGISAGDIYNYIDFEEGVYHHKVGSVDMGTLDWEQVSASSSYFFRTNISNSKIASRNIINIYPTDEYSNIYNAVVDKVMLDAIDGSHRIIIRDTSYSNAGTFKTGMNGKKFNYELAEEEIIPLADVLPPIHVEPNGTIEFVNEHNLDVPSKTIYKKTV